MFACWEANSCKIVPYLLTDPSQFDILQFGWQGTECDSINYIGASPISF
jgi:hypothetical protein